MTNTEQTTIQQVTHFARVLIRTIAHHGGNQKVYVQSDGTLRIVARSVSEASMMVSRAGHYGNLKLEDIADTYQIRFWGTDLVGTYLTRWDPARQGIDRSTGMLVDQSSPELVHPHKHICGHCGQQPLHHVRSCPNKRH
jgi:hypothetical protein